MYAHLSTIPADLQFKAGCHGFADVDCFQAWTSAESAALFGFAAHGPFSIGFAFGQLGLTRFSAQTWH
jgi:hypothetical protein